MEELLQAPANDGANYLRAGLLGTIFFLSSHPLGFVRGDSERKNITEGEYAKHNMYVCASSWFVNLNPD